MHNLLCNRWKRPPDNLVEVREQAEMLILVRGIGDENVLMAQLMDGLAHRAHAPAIQQILRESLQSSSDAHDLTTPEAARILQATRGERSRRTPELIRGPEALRVSLTRTLR